MDPNNPIEHTGSNFNDRLDVLKHVSDIKLKLKNDITNDFVLAKLGDKDKTFIIEMTGNAYFSKELLEVLAEKAEEWVYDSKTETYEKQKLNENSVKKIKSIAKSVFDSYMVQIYMTVVLNRNVDKNYLINVLSGYGRDEETPTIELNGDQNKKNMVSELLADKTKEK